MGTPPPELGGTIAKQEVSLLTETRRLLRRFGLHPRKGLGQHFLIDKGVLETIVSTAELGTGDVVIEVGPGLGILTRELARKAGWVIAIELDEKVADTLKEVLASLKNMTIVRANVLDTDPAALVREVRQNQPAYKLVANLPYYITAPTIRHFLEASVRPGIMVLMVQKEVAESIAAKPGDMSLLSVSVQFYGKPEIVSHVPASSFYPPPEVDSAILKITPYSEPLLGKADEKSFFALVRAGFTASRKQIANSLAQGLRIEKSEVRPLLEGADIAASRRAETLSLDEWLRLWRVFTKKV